MQFFLKFLMFNLLLCGSWPVLKSNPLAGGKSLLQTVLNVHGEQNSPSGEYLFSLWYLEKRTEVVLNFFGPACPHVIQVLVAVR